MILSLVTTLVVVALLGLLLVGLLAPLESVRWWAGGSSEPGAMPEQPTGGGPDPVVVYLSGKDLDRLRAAHNQDAEHEQDYITAGGFPFRFGKLNLLWNQRSVDAGRLAQEYGFTDIDGSRPDVWRFIEEIREPGLDADVENYR